MKTCTKCGRERPLSHFVNDPRYKSQKHPTCRECKHKATGRSRNAGIGRLRDDPAICISAAMYLFEHEGVLV